MSAPSYRQTAEHICYEIQCLQNRLQRAEELLRQVDERLDDMGSRDFGGDMDEEAIERVEQYRKEVRTFLGERND